MPVACLSVDHILCIQKGFENHWGLKIRTVWKGSNLKQQSTYFVIVSGSSYGHPQSVEHPRSRSAQKNPSAGSGSCVFKKCGGGKLHLYFWFITLFCFFWKMSLFKNFVWSFLQLVIVLKKEVIKTNNVTEHEDTDKYRQLLVRTLHSCSVRFPDMAANVIPVVCKCFIILSLNVLYLYPTLAELLKLRCS